MKLNWQSKADLPTVKINQVMEKRVSAFFSGRVQGVGFRFTARSLAGNLAITGWVKNLTNGNVEILAEGQERQLKDFLSQLGQHFSRYIQDTTVNWLEATGEFKDFSVRF